MRLICYIDGASRGNPGPAGAGAYIIDENGNELIRLTKFLGNTTNNVAEYKALILALEQAHLLGADSLEIRSDSQLLVRQMTGVYKIKNQTLAQIAMQAHSLMKNYKSVTFIHIRRELNKTADHLASLAARSAGRNGSKPNRNSLF